MYGDKIKVKIEKCKYGLTSFNIAILILDDIYYNYMECFNKSYNLVNQTIIINWYDITKQKKKIDITDLDKEDIINKINSSLKINNIDGVAVDDGDKISIDITALGFNIGIDDLKNFYNYVNNNK